MRGSNGAVGGSSTCDGPPYCGVGACPAVVSGIDAFGGTNGGVSGDAGSGIGGNPFMLRACNKSRIVGISLPRVVCAVCGSSALREARNRVQCLDELIEWAVLLVKRLLVEFQPDLLQAVILIELPHVLVKLLLI